MYPLNIYKIIRRFEICAKEGNRNNMLYGCIKDLYKLNISIDLLSAAIQDIKTLALNKGLDLTEIESTIISASN